MWLATVHKPLGRGWAARARLPTGGVLLGTAVARAGFLELGRGDLDPQEYGHLKEVEKTVLLMGRRPADWSAGWLAQVGAEEAGSTVQS